MKYTALGVIAGLLLALAAILGGFGGFALAVLFAVILGVAGAHFDGLIDVTAIYRGRGRG